jgi:hypothetical protein
MSKKVIAFLMVLALVVLTPIIFYIAKFHSYPISNDPQDFNIFGGYVGGVVGSVVGIANIVVLIYLTLKVSDYEENRNLRELRLVAINDLEKLFHEIISVHASYNKDDVGKAKMEFEEVKSKINTYLNSRHKILFNKQEQEKIKALKDTIQDLINAYRAYIKDLHNSTIKLSHSQRADPGVNQSYDKFKRVKDSFLSDMTSITLGKYQ